MSLACFLLFPLYVKSLGGSESTLGLLLGVGTAASVTVRPAIGVLLDRVGRRPVLVWCGVGNVLSWVPFFFLTGVGPALFVWTAAHDVVWGALFAAYFTYAADLAPPARRAEGIAVFGIAGMAANGLAPVLGEYAIELGGWNASLWLAIVFGVAAVGLSLRVPPGAARNPHDAPPALRDVVTVARLPGLATVMVATALLGIAINAAYLFVAPFTRVVGLTRAATVLRRVFADQRRAPSARPPDARRARPPPRLRSRLRGVRSPVWSASGCWRQSPATRRPLVLVLCGMACGAGHGSLFPVLNALALSRAPAGKQGAVVGLHTAAIDIGAVLGMPLCGLLAEAFGYPAMFGVMALACVAGLVLMARDARRAEGVGR